MKFKAGDKIRVTARDHGGYRGVVYSVNSHTTAPYPYGVKVYVGGKPKFLNMAEDEITPLEAPAEDVKATAVEHPAHYTWLPNGIEVIDLTEHLCFNRGNAVKYLCRAGRKFKSTELEDLQKAAWYIQREIDRVRTSR